MTEPEIPNYDPLRRPPEQLIELREVVFYDSNKTPIKSLYVPAAEIANKSDEDIARFVQRVFIAHNINVSREFTDAYCNEGIISNIVDSLTNNLKTTILINLLIIYAARLERGDGNDPEIKIVKDAKEGNPDKDEVAALDRIIDHLSARWENNIRATIMNQTDIIRIIWHGFLCNLYSSTLLAIWDEKGIAYKFSNEEVVDYGNKVWRRVYDLLIGTLSERWASGVLEGLNLADIPFMELQKIIRGGLSAKLKVSVAALRKAVKGIENKIASQQKITCEISGDGREFHIKLPEESGLSQEAIIKLLSSLSRGGANNQKIKANDAELRAYPKRYRSLQKELRRIGYVFEKLVNEQKDWRTGLQADFPVMKAYPELIEIVPMIRRDVQGAQSILESIDENLRLIAIEKGFSGPADIAAEIAARQAFSQYKPFDVQPRWLRETYA